MASNKDRAKKLAPWINQTCEAALLKGSKEGMMSDADEICRKLRADDLGYDAWPRLSSVGFHPSNRFDTGLDTAHVFNLIEIIAPRGLSVTTVESKAKTFEVAAGAAGDEQREVNKNAAIASNGSLPMINEADLQVLTVATSHTQAGFRCIEAGVRAPDNEPGKSFNWDEVCDQHHCISKEKFLDRYPSYAPVFAGKGIKVFVIKREVEEQCPKLPAVNGVSGLR